MSSEFAQKGPAQPVEVDQKTEKAAARPVPGKSEQARKDDQKLPGADGQSSAGANEDTFD